MPKVNDNVFGFAEFCGTSYLYTGNNNWIPRYTNQLLADSIRTTEQLYVAYISAKEKAEFVYFACPHDGNSCNQLDTASCTLLMDCRECDRYKK